MGKPFLEKVFRKRFMGYPNSLLHAPFGNFAGIIFFFSGFKVYHELSPNFWLDFFYKVLFFQYHRAFLLCLRMGLPYQIFFCV
jgi:hypothetical protein